MANNLRTNSAHDFVERSTHGSLRGNLADVGAAQIFNLIHVAKKTGTLRFFNPVVVQQEPAPEKSRRWGRRSDNGSRDEKRETNVYEATVVAGEQRGAIAFHRGTIIRAHVGEEFPHVAEILHKASKIDAQQLYLVRNWKREMTEKALALTLINGNYVTHSDVLTCLTEYTLDCAFEIMLWQNCIFMFEEDVVPPSHALTVSVNTRTVIREGMMRTNERRRLEQALPNLSFKLKFPADAGEKFQGAELTVEEWRVVSYVNPDISVGQIAALCQMTESAVRKVVLRLLELGLVERVGAPQHQPHTPDKNGSRKRSTLSFFPIRSNNSEKVHM